MSRKTCHSSASGDRSIAERSAQLQDLDSGQGPSHVCSQFKQSISRILGNREHDICIGYRLLQPFSELNDVPLFDKGFIFYRNDIVDEDRELDPVPPLCCGDMIDIMRKSPRSAERENDISAVYELLEAAPLDHHVDEVANRGLA